MHGTRLIRSGKGGATIHKAACGRATGKTWAWDWAEDRPDAEWVVKAWLKPCRVCLPDLAALQDDLRKQAAA
jgi:hypothetical protein